MGVNPHTPWGFPPHPHSSGGPINKIKRGFYKNGGGVEVYPKGGCGGETPILSKKKLTAVFTFNK